MSYSCNVQELINNVKACLDLCARRYLTLQTNYYQVYFVAKNIEQLTLYLLNFIIILREPM